MSKVPGVISVSVSLLTNSMTVDFDQQKTAPEAIIQAVQQAGYGASLPDSGKKAEKKSPAKMEEDAAASMKKRLIWSMVFMIPLFYLAMGHMMHWPLPGIFLGDENLLIFALTQFLLCLPVLIVNRNYFTGGVQDLLRRSPHKDAPLATLSFSSGGFRCLGLDPP